MRRTMFLILGLLSLNLIVAQTTLNAAGGEFKSTDVTVSYSIGQVFYDTNEGVQMPYNIMELVGVEDMDGISLNVVAYPNPVSDFLELRVETEKVGFDFRNALYQVTDVNGRVLRSEKIGGFKTVVSMENCQKGVYFLEVKVKDRVVRTFKIVKK